jgi:hypothetical protein
MKGDEEDGAQQQEQEASGPKIKMSKIGRKGKKQPAAES